MGPVNRAGQEFITELDYRISASTEDPRKTCFFCSRDYPLQYNDSTLYASPNLLSMSQSPTTIRYAPTDFTATFANF
jgi:hypothetical protein